MRVILTGGGTGGHVYPAVSIGQALREADPQLELLFVGSSHGPEGDLAAKAGIRFVAIPSAPLTKSVSFRNCVSLMKLAAGVFRARGVIKRFGPDVVVGTGGYTSAAILLAQRSLGGKIVIHEQNAVPGRTNRWLARIADKICVSVDGTAAYFAKDKVAVTGLPVRNEFLSLPSKADARRALGLHEELFTVLVTGGSQGAKRPSEIVIDSWLHLDDGTTQVLHQVGQRNLQDLRARADAAFSEMPGDAGKRYRIEPYLDMPVAMASADLIISRSGGTIAEITSAGLPSILFPYPYHRDQHQKRNAEYMVERGAAAMCEDATTEPRALARIISEIRSSPEKLAAMAAASKALGKPDAARGVAEVVVSLLHEHVPSPGGEG